MQKTIFVLAATLLISVITAAEAQDVRPDRLIKYRQAILRAQNWNAGIMAAMIKGNRPYDKDAFVKRATWLESLSHMAWEGFPPGSDQGAPTKAKPEIWKEPAKFNDYADKLQIETAKLVIAARTGDMNQIRPAFSNVDKACNNCHDDFRAE